MLPHLPINFYGGCVDSLKTGVGWNSASLVSRQRPEEEDKALLEAVAGVVIDGTTNATLLGSDDCKWTNGERRFRKLLTGIRCFTGI